MKVSLPYGSGMVEVEVPDKNLIGIVYPNDIKPQHSHEEYIMEALRRPMGTLPLNTLAKGKKSAVIVVDDNTRPCPTALMLPHVLNEIERGGIKMEAITILFATGTHRDVKPEEAERLLGKEIAESIRYVSNHCKGEDFTYIGTTSKGTRVKVKNTYLEADLKVLLGDVEIHYFAGYGGGRKSILPGICHYSTIQHNYTTNFFSPDSRPGKLDGNPMYENMTEAARLAQPHFCLNVVLNAKHQIVGAFAGDIDLVLRKGVALVDKMYKVRVDEKPDILLTAADGAPHDVNLYQAYKALHLGLRVVKDKGVAILIAECPDGHGSAPYREWMAKYKTAEEMAENLAREFVPGGHKAYYHMNALKRVYAMLYSTMPKEEVEGIFKFKHVSSPQEALNLAFECMGRDARVLVVPRGTTTLME